MEKLPLVDALNSSSGHNWISLGPHDPLSSEVLAEILDGGQSFRWNRLAGNEIWRGQWLQHAIELTLLEGQLHYRSLSPIVQNPTPGPVPKTSRGLSPIPRGLSPFAKSSTGSVPNGSGGLSPSDGGVSPSMAEVRGYLDLERFDGERLELLPTGSDRVLSEVVAKWRGLRLLKQDPWEALLGFLCSSNKQIVQIKAMVEALARTLGEPIGNGLHGLPRPEAIAAVGEEALRSCKLGYRARYVAAVARRLADDPLAIGRWGALSYPELKAALMELPGVGEKVADCVALFGFGRAEAFPVDTWILKVMEDRYGLSGWKPAQIAHFGRVHFGAAAGIAQQFLFADARRSVRKSIAKAKRET